MRDLLKMQSNSNAIIENNAFTENNMSVIVYSLKSMSNMHLNNVVFTRNSMRYLLQMQSNSRAFIQNITLTEKKLSGGALLFRMSNIQLINVYLPKTI